MRFKIILLFFICLGFDCLGQNLSNATYSSLDSPAEILNDGEFSYVLYYDSWSSKIKLDGIVFEHKEACKDCPTTFLVKLDKNNNVVKVAFLSASEKISGLTGLIMRKLFMHGDKLYITAMHTKASLIINGDIKVDKDSTSNDGIIIEFDKQLNKFDI